MSDLNTIRRFNRYELKYLIPAVQLPSIIADLSQLTTPDEHGGNRGYRILSLYFDSPGLDFYSAKIEGLKFRRKLRLRAYPLSQGGPVQKAMVEIKQRINRTVQKRRIELPLEQAKLLCQGHAPEMELDALDQQVVDEVRYLVMAMHLRPTCLISYWRRAFVGGKYDAGLRVTFDTAVAARVHELELNSLAPVSLFVPPDWSIMEVKANDSMPDWVISLLARHDCQLRRVSKYCAGLRHLRARRVVYQHSHQEVFAHG